MYNAIRVFIAAYVWMTGFGNFLYYYKTNDFSGVRRATLPEVTISFGISPRHCCNDTHVASSRACSDGRSRAARNTGCTALPWSLMLLCDTRATFTPVRMASILEVSHEVSSMQSAHMCFTQQRIRKCRSSSNSACSWCRFMQMMWRLNFLVFWACLVLRNDYMLYYICPMHTLFTVFVYATLGIASRLNKSHAGIGFKIGAVTALVVACWESKTIFYTLWTPFLWLVGYNDPRKPGDDVLHGAGFEIVFVRRFSWSKCAAQRAASPERRRNCAVLATDMSPLGAKALHAMATLLPICHAACEALPCLQQQSSPASLPSDVRHGSSPATLRTRLSILELAAYSISWLASQSGTSGRRWIGIFGSSACCARGRTHSPTKPSTSSTRCRCGRPSLCGASFWASQRRSSPCGAPHLRPVQRPAMTLCTCHQAPAIAAAQCCSSLRLPG